MSLDILDFPLYEWSAESELQQHESQFSLNIPNLTLDHMSHGKEIEPHVNPSRQIDSEPEEESKGEPTDFGDSNDFMPPEEVLTGDQNPSLRRSTLKFLEMFQ